MELPNIPTPEKKTVQILTILLLFSGATVTANTIITGNTQPDGYQLNVTTLSPTDVKPTEATFRANVTAKDEIYDGAIVYWNYTNVNTGETYRSSYNLTLNKSTVSTLQSGLKAGTNYDVEAYVQPVIWEDEKLSSNVLNDSEVMNDLASSSITMSEVASSNTAMNQVASSNTAMSEVASSNTARSAIFNGEYPIKEISSQNMFDISGTGYEGSETFTGDSQNEETDDSTAYVEITVNYAGTIHYNISVSSESCCDKARLYKNDNLIFTIAGLKTETGNLSVAKGDKIRVEYSKDSSISQNEDQVVINSLYWTPQENKN